MHKAVDRGQVHPAYIVILLVTVNLQGNSSITSFISAVRDQVTSGKSHGHPYQYELEQFKPTEDQLELKEPQARNGL